MSAIPPSDEVRMLVVDDHQENILALEATLARAGYHIETATSGPEALRKVLQEEFAVILLDVVMPIMDGFETAAIIRSREASRHVPIIFLTAQGSDLGAAYKGYSVGAVDYLVKPLDPNIVRAKVAVFADLFRKKRQIKRQEAELRQAERQRSEEALRHTEALFEATFDQAAVGIAHATLDGCWLRVNKRLCTILGATREQLVGRAMAEVVHSSSRTEFRNGVGRLLAGAGETYDGTARLLAKGNAQIWADISMSVLADPAGSARTLIVVVEDISDRRMAEVRQAVLASASETLLRTLDAPATLGEVTRLTVAGGLAQWGAVAIHERARLSVAHRDGGREAELRALCERALLEAPEAPGDSAPESVIGRRPVVLGQAGDGAREVIAVAALDERWQMLLREMSCRSVMVAPIVLRQRLAGLLVLGADPGQRPFGAADLATVEDLAHRIAFATENTRLYNEAQDAINARDEFLSIASHELRTPLTPLQMQIEMLQRPNRQDLFSQPEKLRKIIDRSQRQVRRLEMLIDKLLDVSRAAAGRLELEMESVELVEVVREVSARFSEELSAAGCALTIEAVPSVVGNWDRLRLEQVVTNLVGNAIKYGAGQPIEVRVEVNGDSARLLVRDHGIGIAADHIGRLFERFARAVSSRSYGGLGLGLYIARQIVEGHSGVISVQSSPGEGALFTVEIPCQQPTPVAAPASVAS